MPDPHNAKESYQSFLRKKNTKTWHKLSKTEKVSQIGSNSSSYSDTKKRAQAFKGHTSYL